MPTTIDTIVEHLRAGLSLLEQLHVLSQTQTLLLENGDLAKLGAVVEAKEAIVARIVQAEKELESLQAGADPRWNSAQEVVSLKEQALQRITRISAVERTNQDHLETLRSDLLRRSQNLRVDRKIQETYGQFS